MNAARCSECRAEFTEAEISDAKSCPACGSTKTPVDPAHDVTLTLNWFDLRCLANWAQNWIEAHKESCADQVPYLDRLLDSLRVHRPKGAPGLTLRDEIGQLHDAGINAELTDGAGNVLMKPPTKQ